MKPISNLFTVVAVAAIITLSATIASAQFRPGQTCSYGMLPGTDHDVPFSYALGDVGPTNLLALPALTTNTYNYQSPYGGALTTNTFSSPGGLLSANTNLLDFQVGNFVSAGVVFGFTGTVTSTNDFQFFPSYDGGRTFSTIPLLNFSNLAPGAAQWLTNYYADIHGVTDLAAQFRSRGTTPATNVLFELQFNVNAAQTNY